MDNAPYHNEVHEKCPTKSSLKRDMVAWLEKKGIPLDPSSIKSELYAIISQHKCKTTYKSDIIAELQGHTVLRLPVAHCELNPIELVWAQVKGYAARNNKTFRMSEIKQLCSDGMAEVTAERWKSCVDYVIKVENEYWEKACLREEEQEFVISVGNDSSDSELSETDNDED